ncbi:phosphotransferase [Asticcacaulis sp. BYS171W]|uniref:Phosphotransferase n=1 Tax=Asticcacaulis aquaticus TaxID=2984212 RepID=A0ABT5HSC1_9CAUL|nr:phosphotransferase [Asticcacaulis aquaticus]MDC7682960.1 phosphotransferase [Asticcacaulis aquaticus]
MTREDLRVQFLQAAGLGDWRRDPLPGDASTRRYERLVHTDGSTLMLMDQAPALESQPCPPDATPAERKALGYNASARLAAGRIEAFVGAATYLSEHGLSAPKLRDFDAQNGFLILEDLGDGLFARLIEGGEPEAPLYLEAVAALAQLHRVTPPVDVAGWPLLAYDALALKTGVDLFIEWYPKYDPSVALSASALAEWEALWAPLQARAAAEATVFIHRDYHAENLLWLRDRAGVARVGMIDFQDCLKGHPSWDLHSLLQDARRDVPPELEALCLDHYFTLRPEVDREAFMQNYTALAAMNEARILGIFARLIARDGKPRYEAFIPRMWGHLGRNLAAPGMAAVRDWFTANGFGDKLS